MQAKHIPIRKNIPIINMRAVAIAVLIAIVLAGAVLIGVNQYTESNYSRDYKLACELIDDGNYETAVELLSKLPSFYANTANKYYKEAKYNLAYEYLNSDRYEEASEMFLELAHENSSCDFGFVCVHSIISHFFLSIKSGKVAVDSDIKTDSSTDSSVVNKTSEGKKSGK